MENHLGRTRIQSRSSNNDSAIISKRAFWGSRRKPRKISVQTGVITVDIRSGNLWRSDSHYTEAFVEIMHKRTCVNWARARQCEPGANTLGSCATEGPDQSVVRLVHNSVHRPNGPEWGNIGGGGPISHGTTQVGGRVVCRKYTSCTINAWLDNGWWIQCGGGANDMKCILIVALLGVAMCHLAQAKFVRGEVPGKFSKI